MLDFSAVAGIDSSAGPIFSRIQALAREAGLVLIASSLDRPCTGLLRDAMGAATVRCPSLDEALETAENAVLAAYAPSSPVAERPFHWLGAALGHADLATELAAQLRVRPFHQGELLCHQGEPTDSLIFIDSGRIGVLVEGPDGTTGRVRVLSPQTIAGELGFFLGSPRTATLRAEREASAGFLDRTTFERLDAERPSLTLALLGYVVRVQAERLTFATRQIGALRRN